MNMIDIVVSDTSFSIVCDGEEIMVVGADRHGISLNVVAEEKLHLVDLDDLPSEEIDLQVRGIHRVSPLGSRQPGRSQRYSSSSIADKSDEQEVQHAIDLILESWELDPNQSKKKTAEETRRIAKEVYGSEAEKYRVAGVRAGITRGIYDVTVPKQGKRRNA